MLLEWDELARAVAARRPALRPWAGRTILFQPTLERDSVATLLALLLEPCTTILLPEQDPRLSQRLREQFAGVQIDPPSLPLTGPLTQDGTIRHAPQGRVVIASSGSTGEPKSLLLAAEGLMAAAHATTAHWPPCTRVALQLPLARVAGLGMLLRGWVRGSTFCLVPPGRMPLLQQQGVTHMSCVPSQLRRWLDAEPPQAIAQFRASIQEILVGGSPPSDELLEQAQTQGLPVRVTYALTEASGTVAISPPGDPRGAFEVMPHWSWRVEEGKLALQGESLALGRLTPQGLEPLADPEGWWRTPDLIALEGRGFRWRSRADRVILSGGEKIVPETLERWLLKRGCVRAWVVPRAHAEWGERPVAFVAHSPSPLEQLLRDCQHAFGKRFAPDAIFPLPAPLIDRDKLPFQELQQQLAVEPHGS